MDISNLCSQIVNASKLNEEKLHSKLNNVSNAKTNDELLTACQEFEAYFIKEMFDAMNATIPKDENSLFAKSNAEKQYDDMLVEERAEQMSKGEGIGVAKMLYEQMSTQLSQNDLQ